MIEHLQTKTVTSKTLHKTTTTKKQTKQQVKKKTTTTTTKTKSFNFVPLFIHQFLGEFRVMLRRVGWRAGCASRATFFRWF